MAPRSATWHHLPAELLAEVVNRAECNDVKAIRAVCRVWRDVIANSLGHLTPKLYHPSMTACYPRLRSLDLSKCSTITGEDLSSLGQLISLEALIVQLPKEKKLEAAQYIASLAKLTSLDLSGSVSLEDDQLAIIAEQGGLRQLNVTDCSRISDAGIARLVERLPRLETLICSAPAGNTLAISKVTDYSCRALSQLSCLTHLDLLNHSQITPTGLNSLAVLSQLRVLKLANGRAVCDGGLAVLGAMTGLVELQISFSGSLPSWMNAFTARGLANLSSLHRLQSLRLEGCDWDITEEPQLSCLRALTQLTNLDLSHHGQRLSKLDGRALQHFPLEHLCSLRLNRNRLGQSGMSQLARACALTHLDLSECYSITEHDLANLAGMTALRSLYMDDCDNLSPHTSRAWSWMRGMTQLRELQWANKFASPSWFATRGAMDDLPCAAALMTHASSLTSLRRLSIARQGLAPAAHTMSQLALLTQLTELDMQGVYCEDNVELNTVLGAISTLRGLVRLSIASTRTKGRGLLEVGRLQALTELDISCTPVADSDLHHLKPLTQLRVLRVDDQRFHEVLCDSSLRHVAHISSLTSLSLRGNCAVTSHGLAVLSRLPNLSSLDLRGALNVSAPSALRYLQECTALTELYLGEPDGSCHPPFSAPKSFVHESEIREFCRRLPFLRRIVFGGEVVTSRASYAMSVMQCRLHTLLLDLCKTYVFLVAKYDNLQTASKG